MLASISRRAMLRCSSAPTSATMPPWRKSPPSSTRCVAETGYGVAFFRAGAAPWHDDLACYRRVAARMRTAAVKIFTSLDIWDICALIAASRAYCGSSLHGRIVAMAYALPRLNLIHPSQVGRPYQAGRLCRHLGSGRHAAHHHGGKCHRPWHPHGPRSGCGMPAGKRPGTGSALPHRVCGGSAQAGSESNRTSMLLPSLAWTNLKPVVVEVP